MKWVKKSDRLPENDKRVLCYSSIYDNNKIMAFRIIDAQFVKTCCDVDYWAYIEPPNMEEIDLSDVAD